MQFVKQGTLGPRGLSASLHYVHIYVYVADSVQAVRRCVANKGLDEKKKKKTKRQNDMQSSNVRRRPAGASILSAAQAQPMRSSMAPAVQITSAFAQLITEKLVPEWLHYESIIRRRKTKKQRSAIRVYSLNDPTVDPTYIPMGTLILQTLDLRLRALTPATMEAIRHEAQHRTIGKARGNPDMNAPITIKIAESEALRLPPLRVFYLHPSNDPNSTQVRLGLLVRKAMDEGYGYITAIHGSLLDSQAAFDYLQKAVAPLMRTSKPLHSPPTIVVWGTSHDPVRPGFLHMQDAWPLFPIVAPILSALALRDAVTDAHMHMGFVPQLIAIFQQIIRHLIDVPQRSLVPVDPILIVPAVPVIAGMATVSIVFKHSDADDNLASHFAAYRLWRADMEAEPFQAQSASQAMRNVRLTTRPADSTISRTWQPPVDVHRDAPLISDYFLLCPDGNSHRALAGAIKAAMESRHNIAIFFPTFKGNMIKHSDTFLDSVLRILHASKSKLQDNRTRVFLCDEGHLRLNPWLQHESLSSNIATTKADATAQKHATPFATPADLVQHNIPFPLPPFTLPPDQPYPPVPFEAALMSVVARAVTRLHALTMRAHELLQQ